MAVCSVFFPQYLIHLSQRRKDAKATLITKRPHELALRISRKGPEHRKPIASLRLCENPLLLSVNAKKANEYTNLCVFHPANCHAGKPLAM